MEATGVDDDLPTTIVLHTESFKGLPIESVFISVRISVKDSDPIFILRFIGKDNHDQKRADQFIEILKGKLASLKGEFTKVYLKHNPKSISHYAGCFGK